VAQSNERAALTWTASYEAFGRRMAETGTNTDKQRANTKDEDPTGLLNEGFRYRDLETGVFLSRDPAGFVDGPNVYTYVQQNPWTKFDPEGLFGHIAVAAFAGAVWGAASQAVSDMCSGKRSSLGDYAAAGIGGWRWQIFQTLLRQTARLWRGRRAMGCCHTLADGRAVATLILRWGVALEGFGGKGTLIDGQECPSYLKGSSSAGFFRRRMPMSKVG
jgi:RHS repeat-associated protein